MKNTAWGGGGNWKSYKSGADKMVKISYESGEVTK